MRTVAMLLASLTLFASQAGAVTVTGISTTSGSSATIITQAPGLLEADFAFETASPVRLGLAPDAGEAGFAFNSVVDFFTGVTVGRNIRTLTLSLTGATFSGIGAIAPAFVGYSSWLSPDADVLRIAFASPGEPNAVLLGSIAGGDDFAISFAGSGPATLTILPGIPEPAAWALMIAGFGLVGATARRRRTALRAA